MFYRIARALVATYLRLFNSWEIEGKENMPKDGAVVLVGNHISNWDPLYLACSIDRVVHFMAKEEIFRFPAFSKVFFALQCFPVKRGKMDRNAMRMAAAYLENKEVLGIYPEGTRSKTSEMLPFQHGAAMFALRSNAVIVPVAITGSRTTFPATLHGRVKVRIGIPLSYQELKDAKISNEDLLRVTTDMVESIRKML